MKMFDTFGMPTVDCRTAEEKIIEDLHAQVAELKAENARFAQQAIDHINSAHTLHKEVSQLKVKNGRLCSALADTEALELGTAERLALAQADNQRLREGLVKAEGLLPLGVGSVVEALSTPIDTAAPRWR